MAIIICLTAAVCDNQEKSAEKLASELGGETMQDEEGLQTMRTPGYNMAWMLKNIKNGQQPLPEIERWQPTHFLNNCVVGGVPAKVIREIEQVC